ncbi:MAG: type II toxin-antitoxin system RelE/ParE family toxin [Phycisphaerae bacterium]
MRPAFHRDAERELADAAQWYDDQLPGLGDRFVAAVENATALIARHPVLFPIIPGTGDARRVLVDRFPYQVVYRMTQGEFTIIAIAHVRRRTLYWRKR